MRLANARTHVHTHTHNNTQRGRQERFRYKIRPVCLTLLEQPYYPITSTTTSLLVNVQVNGKSSLLYIQESTGSNPGSEIGYSEVLSWRFSGPAGKCQLRSKSLLSSSFQFNIHRLSYCDNKVKYWGADKSFARPGRKQATATKLLTFASHSKKKKIRRLSVQPRFRGSNDLRVG